MSDNRAYVYQILPDGSSIEEDNSVHQTSPSWTLTVVRWQYRDTLRTQAQNLAAVLEPLIIANDCVQLTVDSDKSTLTPSFTAMLKITDTNYLTAIGPGDFVFVNMLNWESDADRVISQAKNKTQVNGFFDGFKGLFKVQGVRETITVNPETGVKTVFCKLNGYGFTEFNNTIYFNPNVLNEDKDQDVLAAFTAIFGETFRGLVNKNQTSTVANIIAILIQTFIGSGPQNGGLSPLVTPSKNTQFLMPQVIGSLLNLTNVTAAKDIYNYTFGVQHYAGASVNDPGTGFNPTGLKSAYAGYFNFTPIPCQGNGLLKAEYWNQVKAWAILNQYTNAPLNEFFSCFRVDADGDVVPTLVFRQTPFTSETFGLNTPTTRFMTLPRWYVHPTLITGLDIGRDESARINFVQCYAQSAFGKQGVAVSFETAQGNFLYDKQDVKRSGLRPYIWNSTFDEIPEGETRTFFKSPIWAKIVGDCLIGSHLKLNGTITCMGIVEPIAVGDNLEFNDIVFHIEQVTHTCMIDPQSGRKMFRTTIAVSNGVSVQSSGLSSVSSNDATYIAAGSDVYAEMKNTNAQNTREDDFKFNQILPGIAEAQDVPGRSSLDIPANEGKNFSFPQPTSRVVVNKSILQNRKKKQ